MRVLLSGSGGFVGARLLSALQERGDEVVLLASSERPLSTIVWDALNPKISAAELEGFDAVVHLAGENLGNRRWSLEKKRAIRDSRVLGTRALCEALSTCAAPPKRVLIASAIGYYGHRLGEALTESSEKGEGFLSDVVEEWESAAKTLLSSSVSVAQLRFGVILGNEGGALAAMLPVFRFGGGGRLGDGQQVVSWIGIDDVVGSILHLLSSECRGEEGPVNITAPYPVTNQELTETLAGVLRRPAPMVVPRFALRGMLGELADETLLCSSEVHPVRLLDSGFAFRFPKLEDCLRCVVSK